MGSPALDFFLEFGAYCHEHHPDDLWINASTLVGAGVIGPKRESIPVTPRSVLRRAFGMERTLLRTRLQPARAVAEVQSSPVMCFLPFNRDDYVGIVRPYLQSLAKAGTRCTVVVPSREVKRWEHHWEHDGMSVTSMDQGVSAATYREARRVLAALTPSLKDVTVRFRLDPSARSALMDYFAHYALERASASWLIERIAPRAVLGLHFVSNRGWQVAIRGAAASGHKPSVVLVQHGAFDVAHDFHDFEGADLVLLWGERWQRELARFPGPPFSPVPTAVVTGNPKYDNLGAGAESRMAPPPISVGRLRVLYVSSHDAGRTKMDPLIMVLDASTQGRGFDVVVKPHPAARDGALAALVATGKLDANAILMPRLAIEECVRGADIVAGPESTALFEAMRLGKPVVLLSDDPSAAFEGLVAYGQADALAAFVERWGQDDEWRGIVYERQAATLGDVLGTTPGAVEAGVAHLRRHL